MFAQGKASSAEEAEMHRERAARFDAMEDCMKQWFWAQAREDIGGKAWFSESVGMRSGWMFVSTKRSGSVPPFLRGLIGIQGEE